MLAAVTCLFDFVGWQSWPDRFTRTQNHIINDLGIPTFSMEANMLGEPRVDCTEYAHAQEDNIVWQKERMWNLLWKKLPPQFDKVLFVDADVTWENPQGVAREIETLLDYYDVIQPFARVGDRSSFCSGVIDTKTTGNNGGVQGCTGYAWAMRRDWLEQVGGWYDTAATCWGDSIMACAITGQMGDVVSRLPSAVFWDVRNYRERCRGARVGVGTGEIVHDEHATVRGRMYREQMAPLVAGGFDPSYHLTTQGNGLLRWRVDDKFLKATTKTYFHQRGDK